MLLQPISQLVRRTNAASTDNVMSDDSSDKTDQTPPDSPLMDGPAHVARNAKAPGDVPHGTAPDTSAEAPTETDNTKHDAQTQRPKEVGGQKGLEPTRFGDWEKRGRCTDF